MKSRLSENLIDLILIKTDDIDLAKSLKNYRVIQALEFKLACKRLLTLGRTTYNVILTPEHISDFCKALQILNSEEGGSMSLPFEYDMLWHHALQDSFYYKKLCLGLIGKIQECRFLTGKSGVVTHNPLGPTNYKLRRTRFLAMFERIHDRPITPIYRRRNMGPPIAKNIFIGGMGPSFSSGLVDLGLKNSKMYLLPEIDGDNNSIADPTYEFDFEQGASSVAIKRLFRLAKKTYNEIEIKHIFDFLNGLLIISLWSNDIKRFPSDYNFIWKLALLDTEFYPSLCDYVTGQIGDSFIHYDPLIPPRYETYAKHELHNVFFQEKFKEKYHRELPNLHLSSGSFITYC